MLDKEIFEYKDYGHVQVILNELMKSKEITTYQLSNKTNIRFQTIQNLQKGNVTRLDLEVIAKICYVLDCKIEDIVTYIPSK